MMMSASSKKPVWITLTLALVFHTVILSLQASQKFDTSFMRTWLLNVLTPAEKAVDRALYGVGTIWEGYFSLLDTQRENLELRSQLEQVQMQLQKHQEDMREAERLRGLLSLQESFPRKTLVARVIGRDPTHWRRTVTIDKGQVHGVLPDSAVITADGVVGRVVSAGNSSAIVQLVSDTESALGVMVQSSRQMGIVKGNGSRELELDFIEDDNDIKEGDELVTSGMDRIYPKGIPVGTITFVGPRVGLLKTVRIQPRARLGSLEEVLCVIDHPEAIDVVDPVDDSLGVPLHTRD